MKSTRERILEILESHQAISSADLARMTHVTAANIRHHLRQLTAAGLVKSTGQKLIPGRGRPFKLYTLTHPSSNITVLAQHLLKRISEDPNGLEKLAADFSPNETDKNRHITQRLVDAMVKLNELNYRPRWEAHPEGPQIIFAHCPYSEIIDNHPELCILDQLLLKRLLSEPLDLVEKRVRNNEGVIQCRFARQKSTT